MLEDIKNTVTSQANITPHKDNVSSPKVSFKGNPNAVDHTPVADTYQNQQPAPDSPLRTAAFIIPTWYGLNKASDLFDKGCGGTYEKSIMGRLGRLGDRLAGSRVLNNGVTRKMGSTWDSFKVKAQAYIDRHPMLSAMQKTPTKPENAMPKAFMESQNECDIKEATTQLEKFLDKTPKSLKEAGATKAEIEALKQKYGTNIFGKLKNQQAAIQEFQLQKLGGDRVVQRVLAKEQRLPQIIQWYEQRVMAMDPASPSYPKAVQRLQNLYNQAENYRGNALRKLKINKLGLGGGVLDAVKANPAAHAATVETALERGASVAPKLSRYVNKLKSMHVPTTKLGKFLPKMAKLGMRGLTFGGGIINTGMVAFPLAMSIKNAFDAPKDKKAGTLAEGVVDALSWVVSMPLALFGMHAVNGLKNTGLSKDQYKLFKDELKAFNTRAKNGGFASLAEWTAEKNRIEALKNVAGPQSKLTKFFGKVGKVLSVGLEQFTPYKESTANLTGAAKRTARMGNLKRMMPNFLRNCAGYPLRFALYMAVFAPVVDKVMSWGTKLIFGEAYDPEKAKEEQAKEAERLAMLYPGPRFLPNPEAVKGLDAVDINSLSNNNLIKQKILGVQPDAPQQAPANQPFNAAPATMVSGEPFMPPTFPQQPQGSNPQAPQQPAQPDPNVSVNDTVPRSYIPKVDVNAPLPYINPLEDPNQPKNYQVAEAMLNKSAQTIADLDKYMANGYRD